MDRSDKLNESNANILNTFDFGSINCADPSMSDGFKLLYEKELPFEIRIQEREGVVNTLPNTELLRIKVLMEGDERHPNCMRIELTSDGDLYFNFQHVVSEQQFRQVKERQNFYIDFKQYPGVVLRNLAKAEKQPQTYILIFTIFTDFQGCFNIIQRTEFKNYEVLSFDFKKSSDDFIKKVITYRYEVMKAKLQIMETRLGDINDLVRTKNPSLSLQIQKKMPYPLKKPQF